MRGDANRGEARYCASKLCNVMHARALAEQYPNLACASLLACCRAPTLRETVI